MINIKMIPGIDIGIRIIFLIFIIRNQDIYRAFA